MNVTKPLLAAVAAGLLAAPSAGATVPSNNGVIAFARAVTADNTEIFKIAPDGTALTRLTDSAGEDTDPAWSPDGTRIAFASARGGDLDLYVMNADGTNVQPLTSTPLVDETQPAWSPDGRQIAFTGTEARHPEIFVLNTDGTGRRQLTSTAWLFEQNAIGTVAFGRSSDPAWSPDGARIAFASDRAPNKNSELWVMNADGVGQRVLAATPGQERRPTWSPTGDQVALDSTGFLGDGVYVGAAVGGPLTSFADPAGRNVDTSPAWSPDGTKIVYRTSFGGRGLRIMNADGTGTLFLTGTLGDDDPDWQPCASCAPPGAPPAPPASAPSPGTPAAKASGAKVAGKPTDSWTSVLGDPLTSDQPVANSSRSLRLKAIPARLLRGDALAVWLKAAGIDLRHDVRLLGITTSGLPRRCAAKSSSVARRWLFDRYGDGRPVALVTDPKIGLDSRHRLQVYVGRTTAAELQIMLLRVGLARRDPAAGRFSRLAEFVAAERAAKRAKKGLWGRRC